jgi:hypothetical protein
LSTVSQPDKHSGGKELKDTGIYVLSPVCRQAGKQAINSLLEFSSTSELSKNETLANEYFGIKSARARKKIAA